MMSELKNKISKLLTGKSRVKVYTFLGIAAMLLLFLSEIIPSDKKQQNAEAKDQISTDPAYSQTKKCEQRLTELLSKIKDVGNAEVILSCEGSEEYIYAEDISSDNALQESGSSEKLQSKLVLTERSGTKEPIVRKVMMPKFNGALVICDGGGSLNVRERVIKAVSAALDLPTNKICVECRIR